MLRKNATTLAARGVLVSAALVALATGCGSGSGDDAGQVTGTVYTMGGKEAQQRPAEADVTATLIGEDGGATYTAQTTGEGEFTMDLPVGTSEITGALTTGIPGGQITPQEVTVTSGGDVSVELFAIYP